MSTRQKLSFDYAKAGHSSRTRLTRRLLTVLIVACIIPSIWWICARVVRRLSLIYWQGQCERYDNQGQPLWVADARTLSQAERTTNYVNCWNPTPESGFTPAALWPHCWQKLFDQITTQDQNVRHPMFDEKSYPIVFLHERISPGGTKRIVCVQMRPNSDHAQLCSLDYLSISPATISSPPSSQGGLLMWIPGWWYYGVRLDKLALVRADQNDSSHFVFQYFSYPPPDSINSHPEWTDAGIYYKNSDQSQCQVIIIDGWLSDDGTVRTTVSESPSIPK